MLKKKQTAKKQEGKIGLQLRKSVFLKIIWNRSTMTGQDVPRSFFGANHIKHATIPINSKWGAVDTPYT